MGISTKKYSATKFLHLKKKCLQILKYLKIFHDVDRDILFTILICKQTDVHDKKTDT